MAQCITCNTYYRSTSYTQSLECEDCTDDDGNTFDAFDDEDIVEIQHILNPAGRTKPVFSE